MFNNGSNGKTAGGERFPLCRVGIALLAILGFGMAMGMPWLQTAHAAQGDDALAASAQSVEVQAAKADSSCMLIAKGNEYYNCTSKGVSVGSSWSSLNLSKVKTVFIAPDVKKVDSGLFYNHSGLKTVTFLLDKNGKSACSSMDASMFWGSTLKKVNNLEKTRMTTLGAFAFAGTNITSIALPKTLKKMGRNCFSGCTKLKSVRGLEDTKLTKIPRDAFTNSVLTSVSLPETCKSVGTAFGYCAKLKTVKLGSKVSTIDELAFTGCLKLQSINFPAGLTSIGDGAFEGCKSLKSIDLPSSVVKVSNAAFEGCTSLSKVTMRSKKVIKTSPSQVSISNPDRVFGNTPIAKAKSKSYIYVPKSVLAKYKAVGKSSGWYAHRAKFRAI